MNSHTFLLSLLALSSSDSLYLLSSQVKATEITSHVPSLSPLQSFGFSLASGVDIDNNQFNGESHTTATR